MSPMNDQTKIILCVDDSQDNQQLYLKGLGTEYRIVLAGDVDEALRQLEAALPDLILLDVHLPGRSGYDFCRLFRQKDGMAAIPVLFVSGMTALDDRMQGYEAGGDDYICKPIDLAELRTKIELNLQRVQARQSLNQQLKDATATAFTAMSSASETGTVLSFLAESFQYQNYNRLADGVFEFLRQFGLSACLQLRTCEQVLNRSSSGYVKPLEEELMNLSVDASRIVSAFNKCIFNESHLTLLIKNMPLEDEERCGRLRDHLALAVKGMESRMGTMRLEETQRRQREQKVGRSFNKLKAQIDALDHSFKQLGEEVAATMDTLILDIEQAILGMGLEDSEERRLHTILRSGKARMEEVQDMSDDLDSRFLQLESAFIEATLD